MALLPSQVNIPYPHPFYYYFFLSLIHSHSRPISLYIYRSSYLYLYLSISFSIVIFPQLFTITIISSFVLIRHIVSHSATPIFLLSLSLSLKFLLFVQSLSPPSPPLYQPHASYLLSSPILPTLFLCIVFLLFFCFLCLRFVRFPLPQIRLILFTTTVILPFSV